LLYAEGGGGGTWSGGTAGDALGGVGGDAGEGSSTVNNPGENGTTNRGGGGGGASTKTAAPYNANGGNGGSGVVVLKYADTADLPVIGAGLTYSSNTSGGFHIITFTAGTDSIVWA
jgi:hypothetical protein